MPSNSEEIEQDKFNNRKEDELFNLLSESLTYLQIYHPNWVRSK